MSIQQEKVAVLHRAAIRPRTTCFANGYAAYLEVITAQRNVLKVQLANTKRTQFLSIVDLYRVLGGGWQQ